MSLIRRYSAACLAASALLLGACSGGTDNPSSPTPTSGEIGDNPLLIGITPTSMTFESETAVVPGPQTLATSGLVAIGSAVSFGTIQYGETVTPWLRVNPTPTFQRDPLAWLHTVSIDAAAYAALPAGVYTAVVPVIVTAALNSPQMLTVTMCKQVGGCRVLRLGDVRMDEFKVSDPHWDRGSDLYDFSPPDHPYHDWRLFVEPGQTVYVQQIGSHYTFCSEVGPLGTASDMYMYQFTLGGAFVESDDDSCGYNSEIEVSNFTGETVEWLIRATTYAEADDHDPPDYLVYGTYVIRVVSSPFFGPTLRAEPTFEEAARKAAAKQARGR